MSKLDFLESGLEQYIDLQDKKTKNGKCEYWHMNEQSAATRNQDRRVK